MRHNINGRKLGRAGDHRAALYRNLVTDLLGYGKITTTEAKAKEIKGIAERIITLGKKGGLHNKRRALAYLYDKTAVEKVFGDLAERYAERSGGYTRMYKLGSRLGDGASMAKLELVD